MNFEMTKKDVKGVEEITLTISPSDNLEREFFNSLFIGDVKWETVPNTELVVVKKIQQLENKETK